MQVHAATCRVKGIHALGQQAADDAGKHVAGAAGGEAGVGKGRQAHQPFALLFIYRGRNGLGDSGEGAFEYDNRLPLGRPAPGYGNPVPLHVRRRQPGEGSHFAGMGSKDQGGGVKSPPVGPTGQAVQAVGIHQDRQTWRMPGQQQFFHEVGGGVGQAHAAANGQGIVAGQDLPQHICRPGVDPALLILRQGQVDGLGKLGGHDRIDTCRRGQGYQPGPGPVGGPGHQAGRPNEITRPGHNKQMTVGALVGVQGAGRQPTTHPAGSQQLQRNIGLAYAVGQANTQRYQFAHPIRAGEGQQSGLGKAQGQGGVHGGSRIVN